jgi:hypothetical protein
MKTGSYDMRFIIFGPVPSAFETVQKNLIFNAVAAVIRGCSLASCPPEAEEAGIFAKSNEGWIPGPRLVFLPDFSDSTALKISAAGEASANIICDSIPLLKQALSKSIGVPCLDNQSLWHRYGFLTTAGLLLDLQIGESLYRTAQINSLSPGWRILVVPCDPLVPTFGVRCSYDHVSNLGAGVCWHESLTHSGQLPSVNELKALSLAAAGEEISATTRLSLQFKGWFEGRELAIPLLSAAADIWEVIETVAHQIVATIYIPTFSSVLSIDASRDQQCLLVSRMIMEQAMKHLSDRRVVSVTDENIVCKWLWKGPLWSLAAETLGKSKNNGNSK